MVNVAAVGLFVSASFMGDWQVVFKAIAPLCFIIVLVYSRKVIIDSKEEMAESERKIRRLKERK